MQDDDFEKFLRLFSPDPIEASRGYIRLQEYLLRYFELNGVADADGAAIETLTRASTKVGAGAEVPNVRSYCLGIARNVLREEWRKASRTENADHEFQQFMADRFPEQIARVYTVLKPCFDQLSRDDQELLVAYCRVMRGRARAENRKRLAEERDTTLLGLRMRVTRLRASLAECVKRREKTV